MSTPDAVSQTRVEVELVAAGRLRPGRAGEVDGFVVAEGVRGRFEVRIADTRVLQERDFRAARGSASFADQEAVVAVRGVDFGRRDPPEFELEFLQRELALEPIRPRVQPVVTAGAGRENAVEGYPQQAGDELDRQQSRLVGTGNRVVDGFPFEDQRRTAAEFDRVVDFPDLGVGGAGFPGEIGGFALRRRVRVADEARRQVDVEVLEVVALAGVGCSRVGPRLARVGDPQVGVSPGFGTARFDRETPNFERVCVVGGTDRQCGQRTEQEERPRQGDATWADPGSRLSHGGLPASRGGACGASWPWRTSCPSSTPCSRPS
jgi:hypothetical protein